MLVGVWRCATALAVRYASTKVQVPEKCFVEFGMGLHRWVCTDGFAQMGLHRCRHQANEGINRATGLAVHVCGVHM